MIYVTLGPREYLLRLEKGEYFPETILRFYQRFHFRAGIFYGLGACEEVELAFYQPKRKSYQKRKIKKQLEIVSLLGNIALIGYERGRAKHLAHAHITLADQNFRTLAGHLVQLKSNPTVEIYLKVFTQTLKRTFDAETGLALISGDRT